MEYREIVAVTGLGGLFQLLTTKSDGAIVRNLTDKSIKFIPARVHNVTPIESIEIYTVDENVRLHKVLQAIKENEATHAPVNGKKVDNNEIKAYFKAIFPTMDEDRVYVSDMKKILKWYELLKENDLLNFEVYELQQSELESSENIDEGIDTPIAEKKATPKVEITTTPEDIKPAKKARAKKAETTNSEEGEEKPAKKTATRKKKIEE